jgi:hypothetical protein
LEDHIKTISVGQLYYTDSDGAYSETKEYDINFVIKIKSIDEGEITFYYLDDVDENYTYTNKTFNKCTDYIPPEKYTNEIKKLLDEEIIKDIIE